MTRDLIRKVVRGTHVVYWPQAPAAPRTYRRQA